jgi:hypothetical protein
MHFWTVAIVWCSERNQMLQKLDLFPVIEIRFSEHAQVSRWIPSVSPDDWKDAGSTCGIGERDSDGDMRAEVLPA